MVREYNDVIIMMCSLIADTLVPDQCSHGFLMGWGRVLVSIIREGRVYAWGPYALAILYYQMYKVVYLCARSISCGVTLLQV